MFLLAKHKTGARATVHHSHLGRGICCGSSPPALPTCQHPASAPSRTLRARGAASHPATIATQHFRIEAQRSRSGSASRKLRKSTLTDLHLPQAEGKGDPRRRPDAMAREDSGRNRQPWTPRGKARGWSQHFPFPPYQHTRFCPPSMQELTNPFKGQTDESWQNGSQIASYVLTCMLKQSLTEETQFEPQNIILNIELLSKYNCKTIPVQGN